VLLNYSIKLPKEEHIRISEVLTKINDTWTYKKVRSYWDYHVKRKSKNAES